MTIYGKYAADLLRMSITTYSIGGNGEKRRQTLLLPIRRQIRASHRDHGSQEHSVASKQLWDV
jgi:hypothetical protein